MIETPKVDEAGMDDSDRTESDKAQLDGAGPDATGSDATGLASVDEIVASLEELDEGDVTEHVPIFEAAHQALREALAAANSGERA